MNPSAVAALIVAGTRARHVCLNVGFLSDKLSHFLLKPRHHVKRGVLGKFGGYSELAGVLAGNESLGQQAVDVNCATQRRERHQHGDEAVPDHAAKSPSIKAPSGFENPLG